MDIEQRAENLYNAIDGYLPVTVAKYSGEVKELFKQAISAAQDDMAERCAKIAEMYDLGEGPAQSIRLRKSNPDGKP